MPIASGQLSFAQRQQRTEAAVAAYRSGQYSTPTAAARAYGANVSTVRSRITGKHRPAAEAHDHEMRISRQAERAIANHCISLAHGGFPCRVYVLRMLVMMAERVEKPHLQPYQIQPLGKRFLRSYLRRNEDVHLVYCRSQALERRIASNNPDAVSFFFRVYTEAKAQYNVLDDDVWNMDETGFMMGYSAAAKVICMRGRRVIKTIPGSREWCSVIETIAASGKSVPPYIIVKAAAIPTNMALQSAAHLHPDTAVGCTRNGWSNSEEGMNWLSHFERHSRRTEAWAAAEEVVRSEQQAENSTLLPPDQLDTPRRGYRILVMDGHSSHVNLNFVSFCWQHKIIPVCLPPHSTHLLQPLDLVIFRKLKQQYFDAVDRAAAMGENAIRKDLFVQLYGEIRPSVFSSDVIKASFEAAGLSPVDQQKVLDRCVKRCNRLVTPESQIAITPVILSSPFHPSTPETKQLRRRYELTLSSPDVPTSAKKLITKKLVDYAEQVTYERDLKDQENRGLRENAAERARRKAVSNRPLPRPGGVLYVNQFEEMAAKAEKEASIKAEKHAKREQDKQYRIQMKPVWEKQKETYQAAVKAAHDAKEQLNLKQQASKKAKRPADKAQTRVRNAIKQFNKRPTQAAEMKVKVAQSEFDSLQRHYQDLFAIAQAAETIWIEAKRVRDSLPRGMPQKPYLESSQDPFNSQFSVENNDDLDTEINTDDEDTQSTVAASDIFDDSEVEFDFGALMEEDMELLGDHFGPAISGLLH